MGSKLPRRLRFCALSGPSSSSSSTRSDGCSLDSPRLTDPLLSASVFLWWLVLRQSGARNRSSSCRRSLAIFWSIPIWLTLYPSCRRAFEKLFRTPLSSSLTLQVVLRHTRGLRERIVRSTSGLSSGNSSAVRSGCAAVSLREARFLGLRRRVPAKSGRFGTGAGSQMFAFRRRRPPCLPRRLLSPAWRLRMMS